MYTITINKTVEKKEMTRREWKQVRSEEEAKGHKDGVYGYTPSIENVRTVDNEVFKQCVDELNITNVINAINNI